jgi:hypothetical protein
MAWIFDKPLHSLNDEVQNEKDKKLWEAESLGGLTEDNNRLPVPVVFLVVLTVITAFLITAPLWGQRPTAGLYEAYVKSMATPEVMAIQDDAAAMAKIVSMNKGGARDAQLERHPLTMDSLRMIRPQVEALMAKGVDLDEYTVVGDKVVIANFEGALKADGVTKTRKQPWWDRGYTIDVFYLTTFFLGVVITVKRLPPNTWQPKHGNH